MFLNYSQLIIPISLSCLCPRPRLERGAQSQVYAEGDHFYVALFQY